MTKKKEMVYQILIYGYDLTNDTLNNNADIKELISFGIIDECNNGIYKLLDIDGFNKYGFTLLKRKRFLEEKKCF